MQMSMSGMPMGMPMQIVTMPEIQVSPGATVSEFALEGDEPEPTIEQMVAAEMEFEDSPEAAMEDIPDLEDPEDNMESNDPEDDVPDFIDEIEIIEVDPVTQIPQPPPPPPAPVYGNPEYNPECPGVNQGQRCHEKGEDDVHKREKIRKRRNNFLFKKHINDN